MVDRKTNDFITEVASIESDQKEIKNIQEIGQDSYVIYTNISSLQTYTLTSSTYQTRATVTFTADHQNNAFAELNFIKYDGSVSPGNEDPYYSFDIVKNVSSPDSKVTTWTVSIFNPFFGNVTYNVYFYVLSFVNKTDNNWKIIGSWSELYKKR